MPIIPLRRVIVMLTTSENLTDLSLVNCSVNRLVNVLESLSKNINIHAKL